MKAKIIGLAWLLMVPAFAPAADVSAYREGEHYARITPAQPGGVDGKVEVVELFWYGCPHCYTFEPYVKDWLAKKPGYVEFVRVPAIFSNPRWRLHARAFYTAEVLGVLNKLHDPMFKALQEDNRPLNSEAELMKLFAEQGVAKEDFKKAFDSFAVASKVRRAEDLTRRYGITGVPVLVVNGKYRVDGPMAKSYEDLVAIANFLARQERDASR